MPSDKPFTLTEPTEAELYQAAIAYLTEHIEALQQERRDLIKAERERRAAARARP